MVSVAAKSNIGRMSEPLRKILDELKKRPRTPVTTYRLQLHKDFPFTAATNILPYLNRLGISDCYTSPFLKAGPGSLHGYDICDHNQLNPELGTEMEYEAFCSALHQNHLRHLLDFVPNHMGVYPDTNLWWKDVLENGPSSPYARYFDIDWHPNKPELNNKVLLPILGDQYGQVLEKGELSLVFEEGTLALQYYDKRVPISPTEVPRVLRSGIEPLQAELKDDVLLREFLSVLTELSNLPIHIPVDDKTLLEERQREILVARDRLARVVRESPRIRDHIRQAVSSFNGKPGEVKSFDRLHELLEAQNYRLSYWRTASHEINYRRFFDVNTLGGIRMEWDEVFQATHALTLRLLAEDKIHALRLDHPDGLYDPSGYFEALQQAFLEAWVAARMPDRSLADNDRAALKAWREESSTPNLQGPNARSLYVVGEKILSTGEVMPDAWRLDGSSGYDFLNDLNRLYIDSRNAVRFREVSFQFTGKRAPLDVVVYASKRLIMTTTMASELNVLAHALNRISEGNRSSRDYTLDSLRDALREVVACFPVYRTYITASECTDADRQIIDRAISRAKRRNPAMESSIFKFVREVLVPHDVKGLAPEEQARRVAFSMKFQQYTGPVQAKGLEDTAFYRYVTLMSINEVGGDPGRFGGSLQEFHDINRHRREEWPNSMLGSSTHDTKRGEDGRARLNVLSEMPDEWERQLKSWRELVRGAKTGPNEDQMPDANDEYLFYQALLGAWSLDGSEPQETLAERMKAYMTKATREAKLRTSWVTPNEDYEKAVEQFVQESLLGTTAEKFWPTFSTFGRRLAYLGMMNSLSQVIAKIASPGVADFYQGCEFWDLSLVDPDNRRPIDYAKRRQALQELEPLLRGESESPAETAKKLLADWPDGRVKLLVTALALRVRQAQPALFLGGEYLALETEGPKAEHCFAVARRHEGKAVIALAPRWVAGLFDTGDTPVWEGTTVRLLEELATTEWLNIFTGATLKAAQGASILMLDDLIKDFPVALLIPKNEAKAYGLTA